MAIRLLCLVIMRKIKLCSRQIARFCGQLQMLLSSGVPLLDSLKIIKNMTRHDFLDKVSESISEGKSLGESLKEYLPPMVVSAVCGAEQAGNLEEVLGKLVQYYEQRAETEEKIKSALVYPCFVTILSLSSLVVMFVFVLPGFKTLFLDLGADLPLFSRLLIGMGEMFSNFWYLILLLIFGAGVLFSRYRKTEKGAMAVDQILLKIKLFSQEQIIQGFRTLGSLLDGGIPILEALKTTTNSSRSRVFQKIIQEVRFDVENGEKLSAALNKHRIFPGEATQMIMVGENSGKLSDMLLSVADFYEKEREVFIKRFTAMLEPSLTLAVGLMVGLIALAMFLPMLNVISRLQ